MGDTFANPYTETSPLGAALKNLSGVLTKPSNEAANLAHLEHALALKQSRENKAGLGDALRNLGTDQFDRRAAIDMAVRGGVSPEAVGGFERYNSANQYGAADPRTSNAFVGAGGAYGSTAAGFRETQAGENSRAAATLNENARQFDNKPTTIGTDKGPVIVRQNEAYGQPAVEDLGKVKGNVARVAVNSPAGLAGADTTTKQFIGAEGKGAETPRNYVAQGQNYITNDGLTDARTGQPLPQGGYLANAQGPAKDVGLTTSVQGDLQKQNIANDKFKSLLALTRKTAEENSRNFGAQGIVKGAVQDAAAVADGLSRGLGYTGLQEGLAAARDRAIKAGVDPGIMSGVFDPTLPKLHSLADLTIFSAAEALAGQSGRGVSDKDVKIIKNIVGDPSEWSMHQDKFLSKIDTLGQVLQMNQDVVDKHLPSGNSAAGPGAPGAVTSPMSPAPGMQPQAPDASQAKQAADGNFYVPDPSRPGKYLQVTP